MYTPNEFTVEMALFSLLTEKKIPSSISPQKWKMKWAVLHFLN